MKWVSDVDEVGDIASPMGWGRGTIGKGKTMALAIKQALSIGLYNFG